MLVVIGEGLSTKEEGSASVGFAIKMKSQGFVSASGVGFSAYSNKGLRTFLEELQSEDCRRR